MNLKAHKLSMTLLVIFSLTWSSLVQAFFCFSIGAGAGSKHRNRHYSQRLPPAGFGTVAYPLFRYTPVQHSPVVRHDLLPAPVLPESRGGAVKQQIFE
jgi:hypothetical protein